MQNRIKIGDLTGIHRTIAEKANINGGKTLEGIEISIFNDIESTYNQKNNTYVFEGEFYNGIGNIENNSQFHVEQPDATNIKKPVLPENMVSALKNNKAIEDAKAFAKVYEKERNKTVKVTKNVNGKTVSFTYNRASIEDYIINHSKDAKGNKITYFSDITAIRKKVYTQRTKEECKKLIEFNNMVDCIIKSGTEYGVDPKVIVAIIQREVNFKGIDDSVCGVNGKGYMQITSAPIRDMLGGYTKNRKLKFAKDLNTDAYGPEFVKLLKSRGFNPNCPPNERAKLVTDIMKYLKANNDVEFNIRMGTIILRRQLNKYNGDVKLAAQNYNGNNKKGIKYAYGKAVSTYYDRLNILEHGGNLA